MDIRLLRRWMYDRVDLDNKTIKDEYKSGVYGFIDHAMSHAGVVSWANEIRCPCRKCKNLKYIKCDLVVAHLCKWGFKPDYWYWTSHGEVEPSVNYNNIESLSPQFFHNEVHNRLSRHLRFNCRRGHKHRVSNKGTVYGLGGRASCVRPTRSTQNSYTQGTNYTAAPPDEQTIERLNYVENKLTSFMDLVETMRAQHKAELEMQRMMYVQMLSASI